MGCKNVVKEVIVSLTKSNWTCSSWKILMNCALSCHHFKEIHQYFYVCKVLGQDTIKTWCSYTVTSEFAYHVSRWTMRSPLSPEKEVIKRDLDLCWIYSSTSTHIVLYFAKHMLYWSSCYLQQKSNPFSQLTCMKSLWGMVLFSSSKCGRICPLFWWHYVLFLLYFFLFFLKKQ